MREQVLRGRRGLGRDRRGDGLLRLPGEQPLQLLTPPVVDRAMADDGNQPAGQSILIDAIELAMQLEKRVGRDLLGDVAPLQHTRDKAEQLRGGARIELGQRVTVAAGHLGQQRIERNGLPGFARAHPHDGRKRH